jgi:2-keto-3-deoxy-L-rhamnonate aldolase RhmA
MVRAADSSYHEIGRFLDQGVDGVFMPRIHSRQEAENFLRNVKYSPLGVRGLGASTCPAGKYMGWGKVKDMVEFFNENLVVGIQIETAGAIEDLDGILSLPGIDVAVVGNDDLSLGMGIVGELNSTKYIDTVTRIIDTCEKYNVLPGIACGDPELLNFWHEKGMRLFWAAADICLMWSAAQNQISNIQAALKGMPIENSGCSANI